MKEIVEYLLAGLIVAMLFPMFEILVIPYLRLEEKSVSADLAGLIAMHASQIIEDLHSRGNLTKAFMMNEDFITLVQERIPLIDLSRYGVIIKVTPLVPEVSVNETSIQVKSFINGSLHLLIIYFNGSASTLTLEPSRSRMESGYYVYIVEQGLGNIKSVVAVVESTAARGGGYWINGTFDGYPLGVVENNERSLRLILNKGITGALGNVSIYYFTKGFSNHSYTRYTFNEIFILWTSGYTTNVSYYHIIYVGKPVAGNSSYLKIELNTTRLRYNETYGGDNCNSTTNYTNCRLISQTLLGSNSSSSPVDWGLYNAVLITVNDPKGLKAVPLYPPGPFTTSNSVATPPQTVKRASSHVRLGLFDYYIEVEVWER
ncbi:MAG: hypothetical protein QXU53_06610 [Thermosphaera sp.]